MKYETCRNFHSLPLFFINREKRNPFFPQMNTAIKAVIFFLMIMIPRIIVPLHANDDGISCCEKLYITTSKELSSPRLLGYYEKKANIVQGQVGSVSV